ncbi:MAG: DNA/RNA non-specific endonuclease [Chitinophagaceae bacterium]|nr:MAG: DNA/RNA non-specific endonuclease [Chitinophagaceae bacterium]
MASPRPRGASGRSLLLIFVLIAAVLVALYLYQANRHDVPPQSSGRPGTEAAPPAPAGAQPELPAPGSVQVLPHAGYTIGYRPDAGQAAWVAYALTAGEVNAVNVPRTNNFRPDPMLRGAQPGDADYEGSGYDRGHLAPAEDLSWSAPTMSESFFYSNMSPQAPAFNRGVWKRLEELVRFWATAYDTVYIATGPVLEDGLPAIGPHRVAVPRQYYKAVLRYGRSGVTAIGFLLRNEASRATLKSFAVPVDEIERVTGIDLFQQLPDEIENRIEKEMRVGDWRWSRK